VIIDAVRGLGLAVRHKKTGNAGATKPHVFMGYAITPHGPKVPRRKKQEIRSAVYTLIGEHRRGLDTVERRRSIQGSIAYLRQTNPGVAHRLERQLDRAGTSLRAARRRCDGRQSAQRRKL
jgi:hypothetical protein